MAVVDLPRTLDVYLHHDNGDEDVCPLLPEDVIHATTHLIDIENGRLLEIDMDIRIDYRRDHSLHITFGRDKRKRRT